MKKILSSFACASLLTFTSLLPSSTHAQGWAIEVGPTYNIQTGTFVAPCQCTFADGNGLGLIGAVSTDLFSFSGFSVGLSTGVDFQKFTSPEVDPVTLLHIASGAQEEIKLAYISLDPYLRYKIPGTGLFFQVSPGAEYLVSSSFNHIAGALQPGETPDTNFNPASAVDVRKMSYHAKISAGYSIGLLGFALEPTIYMKEPLTDLSISNASGWHITTLYATLAVRFGM